MAVERKFIDEQIKKLKVDLYIHKELERVGCGKVDVKRTPLGTRIVICSTKPGLVIGRKGKNIELLTETLKNRFKIENPQLEIQEVTKPEFDPDIMCKQLAATLERGIHFRRASYSMLKQIMGAGAIGCQIEITGKISGARARREKFKEGYIKHSGDTALQYVREANTQAKLKPGVLGIKIKITPPKEGLFKSLEISKKEPAATVAEKAEIKKDEKADAEAKKEEKPKSADVQKAGTTKEKAKEEKKDEKKVTRATAKKEEKKPSDKKEKKEEAKEEKK